MSVANFTKGKWIVDAAGNGQITIIDDSILNRHIAYMPMDSMPDGEQEANATLIAAAPELIAALKKIQTISAHMQSKRSSDVNRIASDALAKFQGDE